MVDDNYLYREVKEVPGSDKLRLTIWKPAKSLPVPDEKLISFMVINLMALREKAKMIESVSENKLAKMLLLKPTTLRLWRNKFLGFGGKSKEERRGSSLKLEKKDVFKIMLVLNGSVFIFN